MGDAGVIPAPWAGAGFEAWRAQAPILGRAVRGIQWVVAEWILYGEAHYGERAAQAISETGLAPHTILNILAVARAFPEPSRRRDALSFAHHEAVAALQPVEQDIWLDAAARGEWSVTRLRQAVRAKGDRPAPGVPLAELGDRLAAAALVVLEENTPDTPAAAALRDLAHDWQKRRQR
jgi:hypothetical protein